MIPNCPNALVAFQRDAVMSRPGRRPPARSWSERRVCVLPAAKLSSNVTFKSSTRTITLRVVPRFRHVLISRRERDAHVGTGPLGAVAVLNMGDGGDGTAIGHQARRRGAMTIADHARTGPRTPIPQRNSHAKAKCTCQNRTTRSISTDRDRYDCADPCLTSIQRFSTGDLGRRPTDGRPGTGRPSRHARA